MMIIYSAEFIGNQCPLELPFSLTLNLRGIAPITVYNESEIKRPTTTIDQFVLLKLHIRGRFDEQVTSV